jgi:hypothetical protein
MWCNLGGPQSLGFRFAYDNNITFAIYIRTTEGMQESATAALEETISRLGSTATEPPRSSFEIRLPEFVSRPFAIFNVLLTATLQSKW